MSTRVDAEQIETTRSEKVLAVVLAAFLLVGGIWAYVKVDELGDETGESAAIRALSPAEQQALAEVNRDQAALFAAQRERERALQELEPVREQYRTALEAGEASAELEAAYEQAQARYDAAEPALTTARIEFQQAREAASGAQEGLRSADQERADARRDHDRQTFLLRLLLVAGLLGGSYLLLQRLRDRRSRYLPLGLASVGAAAGLALFMAAEYGSDTIEFGEVGPLAISLVGIAFTTLAFVALQRYVARRIPQWRVKRADCPFCGHPVRSNEHCEGCGRAVMAPCSKCKQPRRVGSAHCGSCGAG